MTHIGIWLVLLAGMPQTPNVRQVWYECGAKDYHCYQMYCVVNTLGDEPIFGPCLPIPKELQ